MKYVLAITVALFASTQIAAAEKDIYIVQLDNPPLASYKGGVEGLTATHPKSLGQRKLDTKSVASKAYLNYLSDKQLEFRTALATQFGREPIVRFEYRTAFNGLALELSASEAQAIKRMAGVVRVTKDFQRELHTDQGPSWIGAPTIWDGSSTGGLGSTAGEGVIVGIIDTGINPDHPSFAEVGPADGYTHVNPLGAGNYVGVCDPTEPSFDPTFPCNEKLIGAWGLAAASGGDPRDLNGHGSHVASTAAGNQVLDNDLNAPTVTLMLDIIGVAPHANIIAYNGCCDLSGLLASINQAVTDGVDVINYSIGSTFPSNPWTDPDALAFLSALDAGVAVATSNGNAGPGPATVGSPANAPWILSVGSSTHDRSFDSTLENMSGGGAPPADMVGKSITAGYGPAPIVYAGDFSNGDPDPEQCLNPFPPGTFSGQIVVCDRGTIARVDKGSNVLAGGAGGFVLLNPNEGQSINSDGHFLPATHLDVSNGTPLKSWLDSGAGHTATLSGTVPSIMPSNGNIISGFSSRGPNLDPVDIIKPSISAPGSDIVAAVLADGGDTDNIGVISGTSMASPHAAGSLALLTALHPSWTPSEMFSALMTTADTNMTKDGTEAADPFDMGSGRVDLTKAARAAMLFDETETNFTAANPGSGGDPSTLNIPAFSSALCGTTCSWTRTVRNPLASTVTWTPYVTDAPPGAEVFISGTLTAGPGESFTYTVSVVRTGDNPAPWYFNFFRFEETGALAPDATMPIAIQFDNIFSDTFGATPPVTTSKTELGERVRVKRR